MEIWKSGNLLIWRSDNQNVEDPTAQQCRAIFDTRLATPNDCVCLLCISAVLLKAVTLSCCPLTGQADGGRRTANGGLVLAQNGQTSNWWEHWPLSPPQFILVVHFCTQRQKRVKILLFLFYEQIETQCGLINFSK